MTRKKRQATTTRPTPAVAAESPPSTVRQLAPVLWAVVCLLAAVVWYGALAAPFYLKYWVDDAAISFTFVRNIAEGFGSVVFPGGERVEGFSNAAWVALLAVFDKIGGEPFNMSQHLGLIFGVGTLILLVLHGALPQRDGRRPWPIAAAALLVASHAGFVIWNQSGMESSLYTVLLAASLLLVAREAGDEKRRPWSALTLFVLAVTRPEGVAFAPLAGVALLIGDLCRVRRLTKRFVLWVVAFAALYGGYHLWHYLYFAHPFPNTFYAKVLPDLGKRLLDFHSPGWRYVTSYFEVYGFAPLLLLTIPAFLRRRTLLDALLFTAVAAFLVFFPIYSNGDWMKSWRFLSAFPVPLGLLLGLAAWNVAGWLPGLVARWTAPRTALGVALVCGAMWVVGPTLFAAADSRGVFKKFEDDREVSAKGIAKRVKWWSDIAHELALRPADTMMCDMDMGGTSYNWPGQILDIGYLLDVPMATHRRQPHWAEMMDRYFFEERRPEFIHIRRGWGRATTIPDNPQFDRQYLRLPEDRKFSSIPNGNFVRRDLFELTTAPANDLPAITFPQGVTLHAAEIPRALEPGRFTPVFLTWRSDQDDVPRCSFAIALAEPDAEPVLDAYEPAMGWSPTDKWPDDRFIREVVYLAVPKAEGDHAVHLAVRERDEDWHRVKLPFAVKVEKTAASKEADRLLAKARDLAQADASGADEARTLMRRAEQLVGEKRTREAVTEIDVLRVETYINAAREALTGGDAPAAAAKLYPAWRIDARNKALKKLGREIADRLYERGREKQNQRAYREAYEAFDAALHAYPQHAWARKRAEEVRMLREP